MLFVLLQLLKLRHCTHSTDARGQDHPAPFDEEDGFVPNHVFNIKVESVTTWKKKVWFSDSFCVFHKNNDVVDL